MSLFILVFEKDKKKKQKSLFIVTYVKKVVAIIHSPFI